MGVWEWIMHSISLGDAGVIVGLLLTVVAMRDETKARRETNLISLTVNHREIWSDYCHTPEYRRVLDATEADLRKQPVTREETIFVSMNVQQLHASYQAMRNDLVLKAEGVRRDVVSFFSKPIPKAVWGELKAFQNDDFVAFVESCLDEMKGGSANARNLTRILD